MDPQLGGLPAALVTLQALRSHPQAVADAFVAVHRARVASKEPPDQHLYDLVRRDEFERVAPLAVPRMFTPFPSCCTAPQVDTLRPVLWAALKYMSLRRPGATGPAKAPPQGDGYRPAHPLACRGSVRGV